MRHCFECGAELSEKTVDYEKTWKGVKCIITGVPVSVCSRCDEKYYSTQVCINGSSRGGECPAGIGKKT